MLSKAMCDLQSSISHGAMSLTIYIIMHSCIQITCAKQPTQLCDITTRNKTMNIGINQ